MMQVMASTRVSAQKATVSDVHGDHPIGLVSFPTINGVRLLVHVQVGEPSLTECDRPRTSQARALPPKC